MERHGCGVAERQGEARAGSLCSTDAAEDVARARALVVRRRRPLASMRRTIRILNSQNTTRQSGADLRSGAHWSGTGRRRPGWPSRDWPCSSYPRDPRLKQANRTLPRRSLNSDDEHQPRRRRHIYNAERMFECTGMAGLPANAPESTPPLSPNSLRFGVGARAMAVLTRAAPTPRTFRSTSSSLRRLCSSKT
jgi:hypothetical protein